MRSPAQALAAGVGLAAGYLLLLPTVSLGDVVVAGVVAAAVLGASRHGAAAILPEAPTVLLRSNSPLRLASLAGHLLAATARGTNAVFGMGLSTNRCRAPEIVELSISELGLHPSDQIDRETALQQASLLGLVDTLTPGTLLVDIDANRRTLLFHVMGRSAEQHAAVLRTLWARHLSTVVQLQPPAREDGS